MCGIITAFNKDKEPVNEYVIERYQDQISRGTQGFGAVLIQPDGEYKVYRATESAKILLDLYMHPCSMIIFHHRYPTSSSNKISQTHPFLVDNGSLRNKYLLVHNGIISNDDELRKEHEGLGFLYTSAIQDTDYYGHIGNRFNDSECLAIEAARFLEGQTNKINIQGSAAFVGATIDRKTDRVEEIFFGKTTTGALKCHAKDGRIRITSEGEGLPVKEEILYSFDIKEFAFKEKPVTFHVYVPPPTVTYASDIARHTSTRHKPIGFEQQSLKFCNHHDCNAHYCKVHHKSQDLLRREKNERMGIKHAQQPLSLPPPKKSKKNGKVKTSEQAQSSLEQYDIDETVDSIAEQADFDIESMCEEESKMDVLWTQFVEEVGEEPEPETIDVERHLKDIARNMYDIINKAKKIREDANDACTEIMEKGREGVQEYLARQTALAEDSRLDDEGTGEMVETSVDGKRMFVPASEIGKSYPL